MVQGLQENRFVKKGEISATTWGSITGTQSDVNVGGFTNDVGYLTSITSGQVITALGYTPYNATNPSGYITSSSLSGYLQNNVGISGGTTLIGGTLSGNNLTLSSTSHATKGKILFGTSAYDEVNNRLGIGTISPTASLDVSSPSGGVGTGIRLIQATNNVFQPFSYTSIDFTVPTTGLIGQFFATASNYSNPNVNLAANSIGLLSWDTNAQLLLGAGGSNGYISFDTGGYGYSNERMRILANGKVGIGTTTPGNLLSIVGNSSTPGGVAFDVKNSNVSGDTRFSVSSSNNRTLNVQVTGDSYAVNQKGAYLFTNGGLSNMTFMTDGDVGSGGSGYISFATGGYTLTTQERMRITSTGNIGIGITSPSAVLHLKAGTATAGTAPLKFTSGTNLTTAEAGAMEWDGSRLYITNTTPTRNTIAYLTDIVAGTDNYVDSVSFNTGNGVLTLGRTGALPDLTTSLDGRYALSSAGMPTGTEGQMLYNNAGVWTSFSGMYWDDTNNRLGVGTNSPSVGEFGSTFTVKGTGSEVGIITAQRNVSALANGTGFQTVLNNASSNPVTYSYFNGYIITNTAGAESGGLMFFTRNAGTLGARMTILNDGNTGIGTTSPTAYLHLKAGTATANTAPLKFTSGTNTTVAVAGQIEYNNTFHLTNSDATRRHVVTAPNTTKVTAAAPYTNDGYIIVNIGGIDFKLMTTA